MKTMSEQFQKHIRSEILSVLREIDGIENLLEPLAQFTVVVDANIILGDLIWLVSKRKNPDATTELVECINAGTIVAYVARPVLAEVDEHISTIAVKKNLPEDALRKEWKIYRKILKVRTPRRHLVDRFKKGQDPDDAPTIALEKMIRADGILSKDNDIVAMGGLLIDLDFTSRVRDYSRKTAVAATIRCSGGIALTVSWVTVEIFLKLAAECVSWFRRLPAPVKIVLFFAVVVVSVNKNVRERVMALIAPLRTTMSSHWPEVIDWLASVDTTLAENTIEPPVPTFKMRKIRRTSS
ncbi:putative toxin-antitoxin system toxin component, PIN family [Acidithiobacillus montserratensis]|uniref:Toxin-antitoxin system toxin component, PIN family n=1 Tax=Acidithiobacillus montserratensis TaxID=2729135 RepID=A0ACD5HDK9_9PROT|nr:putative toxin-antitoxin system toxin component, PIN family [Acidithiobacillus montserratensis]MBU2747475.1 putative toxin-antitoxin system toxin component, PIN family [Acidithiobacillus montserratensis]